MSTMTAARSVVRAVRPQGRGRLTRGERNALVLRHMALARALARRYANRGEPYEDLEQVAAIGLMKAIDRFDPSRGNLLAFATPTVLGELRRHFRDRAWAIRPPRPVRDGYALVARATDTLTAANGRSPSVADIAQEAGLSEERVLDAVAARSAYRPVSLSQPPAGSATGEDRDPVAVPAYEEGYDRVEDRVLVTGVLGRLPARERAIVILRFRDDLTQGEIARRLGISQMHVSRLLRRALATLRDDVAAEPA
jgi:RNA polymerase sigma-B factor